MASSGSGGGNNPNAWLGLLKWSLSYSDGTKPSGENMKQMSKEDIAFLESVMKDGIIDEGERMKTILKDLTDSLEVTLGNSGFVAADADTSSEEQQQEEKRKELEEDDMLDLMQELRDIVEQIDYARAFMAMGGIPFLLGCAASAAPKSIKKGALSILSTMCQNNPPVQLSLLEHGHMPPLIQLFFDYTPGMDGDDNEGGDDSIREKVVQALSASIRGHSMAEHIFCQNEHGRLMLQLGLGMQKSSSSAAAADINKPSVQLRKRSLFLLRAILTSDEASDECHKQYQNMISYICTHEINEEWEDNAEIREMSLAMLSQLLTTDPPHKFASDTILSHKNQIGSFGVKRIDCIRKMEEGSDEREYAALELEEWERIMVALAESSK
jgi:hsp70-interacting protein